MSINTFLNKQLKPTFRKIKVRPTKLIRKPIINRENSSFLRINSINKRRIIFIVLRHRKIQPHLSWKPTQLSHIKPIFILWNLNINAFSPNSIFIKKLTFTTLKLIINFSYHLIFISNLNLLKNIKQSQIFIFYIIKASPSNLVNHLVLPKYFFEIQFF